METDEKKAVVQATQTANKTDNNSVRGKTSKVNNNRKLTMESTVRTLGVKCYEEQLKDGWESTIEKIKLIDKSKYHVVAILHDKDTLLDDIWQPSVEKPHYHICFRTVSNSPVKVRTVLKMLGVEYRPVEDDMLWTNHGVETLRSYSSSVVYLTHETEQAILDGKFQYNRSEIVSNLDIEELDNVRDGYIRVSVSTKKVTEEEMAEYCQIAYSVGHDLKSWDDFYFTLPLKAQKNTGMKVVKDWYNKGIKDRVAENPNIVRCCIFITGKGNQGKTYNSMRALKDKKIVEISSGGTGRLDRLEASTDAIVLNDGIIRGNLLDMTDNKMTEVYRRNKDNPFWCGQYFVVTTNKTFSEWAEECGIYQYKPCVCPAVVDDSYIALEQRFFVCHVDVKTRKLVCDKPSKRGGYDDQMERKRLYKYFRKGFEESFAMYNYEERTVDYSDILDSDDNGFVSVQDAEQLTIPFDIA